MHESKAYSNLDMNSSISKHDHVTHILVKLRDLPMLRVHGEFHCKTSITLYLCVWKHFMQEPNT